LRFEQSLGLVEAQRTRGGAGSLGQFADPHAVDAKP
jgi:hypothetical protein